MRKHAFFLGFLFAALVSCNSGSFHSLREVINLNGTWKFALDTAGVGISEKWHTTSLSDSVKLPGTLDENNRGIINTNKGETMRLSRERMFEGMAWYQKEIEIPKRWSGKHIQLNMERTKPTMVWVDTMLVGKSNDILAAQVYDLSIRLSPGKHTLTILVDNGKGCVPQGITGSHSWTEHTQTNWNGIVGKFNLEASNTARIIGVQVYPDIDRKTITAKVKVFYPGVNPGKAELTFNANAWNTEIKHKIAPKTVSVSLNPGENILGFDYELGEKAQLWSEFNPAMYKLEVTLSGEKPLDNITTNFGMRKFTTSGTQFTINGLKTFLRGKHDACIFPLTGYPPMDVESWQKVFKIAKSYNINFYRFHSWTPPLAAFEAADIEGIYLQPELPFWGGFSKTENLDLNAFLLKESKNILDVYGNHASFVMFALGNELSGDLEVMQDMVKQLRLQDDRHLYAFGSNNYLGTRGQVEGEDYYAGCRVGADTDSSYRTHIRASFSFADANEGGDVNGRYPSTNLNYAGAISKCSIPALGTEVGQYQIYPNYDEIKKYTGVLKPWNFEVFKKRLEENNLSDQAKDFFKASGALSVICYRADIEMALRTPGFGGFHLLDLQDFSGQGTALVGILDAFMDSKGLITPDEFSQFCNRVVPLLLMEKYCWTNNETFKAKVEVANYSADAFKDQLINWVLKTSKGEVISQDKVKADIPQGALAEVATLNIDLSKITKAEKVSLEISLEGTPFKNAYPLWIYPAKTNTIVPKGIQVSEKLDKNTLQSLANGAKVLLFPNHKDVEALTVGGLFTPDYWNYRMFKGISEWLKKPVSPGTMSILTNPELPMFSDFPTEFHSNWQWWSIVKNSRPFILDNTPKNFRPSVQVVDNIERNHKLGLIFEFTVGKGKLLVCMSNLKAIQDKPEARQLYSSLLKYMESDSFQPKQNLTPEELTDLFSEKVTAKKITGVKNISYE